VPLPLLRKDFVIDVAQIYEARVAGADAILVIVAAVPSPARIAEFVHVAAALGMDALVEVHDERELNAAKEAGARLIGVNNRDLKTFRGPSGNNAGVVAAVSGGGVGRGRVGHPFARGRGAASGRRRSRRTRRRVADARARYRRRHARPAVAPTRGRFVSSSVAVLDPAEPNTAADSPPRLREAELADAATVVSLIHAAFDEYRGVLDPPPAGLSETPASVRAHIKRGDAGVLLVELKGQPVGCVFYAAHPADGFVHLGRLSVHPTARGRGVGNVLIAGVEARARQFGLRSRTSGDTRGPC
jgi:GNAT superfamily N-acetyltransferase